MLKAIIIDDEELARELVKNYLSGFQDLQIIGECENGFEGIKAINDLHPDLVFLDVQMPKLNGFEMLEIIEDVPQVIFITAHNEYAIRAFEMNAVDYLMKPFSKDRLLTAVSKAVEKIRTDKGTGNKYHQLIRQPLSEKLERVVVKSGNRIKVIPVDEIIYLEAQDDYVMIHTNSGRHLKKATMNYFEDHLDTDEFMRVHRSYMVRIKELSALEPYAKDNFILKLRNGTSVKVSRSGLRHIREKLRF